MASSAKQRFLKYVGYDTQSAEDSAHYPSTQKQLLLGRELVEEMKAIGIADAKMDEYGYVTGTIASNTGEKGPVLGLLAHIDTSPAMPGQGIKPRELHYTGGDIVLNEHKKIVMRASEFSFLEECVDEHLIVTDGTTLLGADDKAGVAEILAAAEILQNDASLPHGEIRIGFTPDEEVGSGTEYFDVKAFGADFAYTVDGGAAGELEYENFNAATVKAEVLGVSIHPGTAKNRMINAATLAFELHGMLPPAEKPEHTEGYEGFYHLDSIAGDVERTVCTYIVRDHDEKKFEKRIALLKRIAAYLNEKYGEGTVTLHISESYRNMKEKILPHFHLVETAQSAMEDVGLTPRVMPIRGGTDGARLSCMGLPCPNLGTGGYNAHGRYECLSVEGMEKTVELLLRIIMRYANKEMSALSRRENK